MRKICALTLAIVLLSAGFCVSAGYAATTPTTKAINATYGVQVEYNSKTLTGNEAPFIVNNTTFVPLRMVVEAFNDKSIAWDNANRKVVITGSGSLSSNMEQVYTQKIASQNSQIADLQAQIATLNSKISTLQSELNDADSLDLDDIEDALTASYGDYDDNDYSFTLSGDSDDITVYISTDEDTWNDLSTASKTSFLQYVCNKVWNDAEDADITGTVKDSSTTLTTFIASAGGTVSLSSSSTLSSLKTTLNDKYGTYYSTDFTITLSGDSDDVTVVAEVDSDDWDEFSTSQQEYLLQKICDTIWDTWDDADVDIAVKDGSTTLDSVSVDAGDSVSL